MPTVTLPAAPETETTAPEKSIREGLQRALDLLRSEGWCQHELEHPNGDGGHSRCSLGVLWAVREDDVIFHTRMGTQLLAAIGLEPGDPYPWKYTHDDDSQQWYTLPDVSAVARWNDSPERTQEQVETVFEYAIEKAEN